MLEELLERHRNDPSEMANVLYIYTSELVWCVRAFVAHLPSGSCRGLATGSLEHKIDDAQDIEKNFDRAQQAVRMGERLMQSRQWCDTIRMRVEIAHKSAYWEKGEALISDIETRTIELTELMTSIRTRLLDLASVPPGKTEKFEDFKRAALQICNVDDFIALIDSLSAILSDFLQQVLVEAGITPQAIRRQLDADPEKRRTADLIRFAAHIKLLGESGYNERMDRFLKKEEQIKKLLGMDKASQEGEL